MTYQLNLGDDQRALVATARDFARREIVPRARALDAEGGLPADLWARAWEAGLVGAELPAAVGGAELDPLSHALVLEEIAYGCAGVAAAIAAHMEAALPVCLAGSDDQRRTWLGALTAKPLVAAAALGADDPPRARREGDAFVLDGRLRRVAHGGRVAWLTALAALDGSHAVFLLPGDAPGVRPGAREAGMGERAAGRGEVVLEAVVLPHTALVGDARGGLALAARVRRRGRPWIAAMAAGLIRRALDEAQAYARERRTFGVPIAEHGAVQLMLADIQIAYSATRSLALDAAFRVDREDGDLAGRCAEAFAVDAALRSASDAVQIFGGYGYLGDYPVEKLLRDAALLRADPGPAPGARQEIARALLAREPAVVTAG